MGNGFSSSKWRHIERHFRVPSFSLLSGLSCSRPPADAQWSHKSCPLFFYRLSSSLLYPSWVLSLKGMGTASLSRIPISGAAPPLDAWIISDWWLVLTPWQVQYVAPVFPLPVSFLNADVWAMRAKTQNLLSGGSRRPTMKFLPERSWWVSDRWPGPGDS